MKSILRVAMLGMLAGAIAGLPLQTRAQSTNKPAATKSEAAGTKEKKPGAGPFHGKLAAVDKTAKTITVGKRTFQITSETKIKKAGKPATLADGVVGEEISGYIKPTEDGKLVATTVNFGPKADAKGTEKAGGTDKGQR